MPRPLSLWSGDVSDSTTVARRGVAGAPSRSRSGSPRAPCAPSRRRYGAPWSRLRATSILRLRRDLWDLWLLWLKLTGRCDLNKATNVVRATHGVDDHRVAAEGVTHLLDRLAHVTPSESEGGHYSTPSSNATLERVACRGLEGPTSPLHCWTLCLARSRNRDLSIYAHVNPGDDLFMREHHQLTVEVLGEVTDRSSQLRGDEEHRLIPHQEELLYVILEAL